MKALPLELGTKPQPVTTPINICIVLGNEFGEPIIVERQIRIMDQPFSKSKFTKHIQWEACECSGTMCSYFTDYKL